MPSGEKNRSLTALSKRLEVFLESQSTETNIHVACSRGIAVIPNSNNLFFSIFYTMEREIPETSLGEA